MDPNEVVELDAPPNERQVGPWTRRRTARLAGVGIAAVAAVTVMTVALRPKAPPEPEIPGLQGTPKIAWSVYEGDGLNYLYTSCGDGGVGLVTSYPFARMECRNVEDGEVRWAAEYRNVRADWLLDLPDAPYVSLWDLEEEGVTLIDRIDGDVAARVDVSPDGAGEASGVVAGVSGRVLVSRAKDSGAVSLRALNVADPEETLWEVELPSRYQSLFRQAPAIMDEHAGHLWVRSADQGGAHEVALSQDDGAEPEWSEANHRLAYSGSVVVGFGGDTVTAADISTGRTLWTWAGEVAAVVPGPDAFYGAEDKEVSRIDSATGRLRWTTALDHRADLIRVIDDGVLVANMFPERRMGVTLLDARTGEPRWSTDLGGGQIGRISTGEGQILIEGVAFAVALEDGDVRSFVDALDLETGASKWRVMDAELADGFLAARVDGGINVYR